MKPYTIKEVAKALEWKPSRIEKMISREQFTPEQGSTAGRYGRGWTYRDVIRLRVFDLLPTMNRQKVIEQIPFDELTDRYLMIEHITGPVETYEILTLGGSTVQGTRRPADTVRIVRSADVPALLKNPWAGRVDLISLENVETRVREGLDLVRASTETVSPKKEARRARPHRPEANNQVGVAA